MTVLVRIMPGDELKRVADALRVIDATFPSKLRRRLRRGVAETVKDVKTAVRTMPVVRKSNRNKGLRRQIARGVRVQVATGGRTGYTKMRIVTVMPRGKEMLPRGTDVVLRPHAGWVHPVFDRPAFMRRAMGRKRIMVRQGTGSGWFREEISDHRDAIERELAIVLDEARDLIRKAARTGGTPSLPASWQ